MTLEQSLAVLFVSLWIVLIVGTTVRELCFKPGP